MVRALEAAEGLRGFREKLCTQVVHFLSGEPWPFLGPQSSGCHIRICCVNIPASCSLRILGRSLLILSKTYFQTEIWVWDYSYFLNLTTLLRCNQLKKLNIKSIQLDEFGAYTCETITTVYAINISLTSKSFLPPSLFIISYFGDKNT